MKYSLLSILILLTGCSPSGSIEQPDFQTFEARSGFEIFFDSGASQSAQSLWTSGSIVVNGSYFGLGEDGLYYPAGWWRGANKFTGYMESFGNIRGQDDPNLSHVVKIGVHGTSIFIVPNYIDENPLLYFTGAETWGNPEKWFDTEIIHTFQAGPLVLSGNILQDFGKSWHAHEQHERTLIGVTEKGRIFFFIFTGKISLTHAGERIRRDEKFVKNPITVINLDGGPSTTFYDGKNGFRENQNLPILIKIN